MASRFCKLCDIDYPVDDAHRACHVCGDPTIWQPYKSVDPEWEAKVEGFRPPVMDTTDKVFSWRYTQLQAAGYTAVESLNLAASRVDLHKARTLRAKTDLAYEILN